MMSKKDKKLLFWNDLGALDRIKNSLAINRISITSTDTILGFISQISEKGFQELNSIKGNRVDKPYLIVIGSLDKLKKFVQVENFDERIWQLLHNCWPGPVTIIFKARQGVPSFLTSAQGTIALRCPQHEGLLTLLTSFDGLFSTSANKSGEPVPTSIEEISNDILEKIDYIVMDENVADKRGLPSTILNASIIAEGDESQTIRVVREGAYSIKELERYYGLQFKK